MYMNTPVDVNVLQVIQELSQQVAGTGSINDQMPRCLPNLKVFHKAQPKALGTVQTMTGIVIFLLGLIMEFETVPFYGCSIYNQFTSVGTYIVYWGPFIFLIAGSLSIAAENKLNPCLVKGSLGMNVISAITAVIAVFILICDIFYNAVTPYDYTSHEVYNCSYWESSWSNKGSGISGVLLVFCLLQLIISIFLSAFACRAICDSQVVVAIVQNQQFNSQTVPIPIPSITEDYINVGTRMSMVVNRQREREAPPTEISHTTDQDNEHEYEQLPK